jgi:hypothetical protein
MMNGEHTLIAALPTPLNKFKYQNWGRNDMEARTRRGEKVLTSDERKRNVAKKQKL